jgi:hypothetical protein
MTTHLVVFDQTDLSLSKKLVHIKTFKKRPMVVNQEWLIDCMEAGRILDGGDEKYKINV